MNANHHTHVTVVLDRSGSMAAVRADAIGGFNTFVERQRKLPGTATLTLVQFDDVYEVVHRGVDIRDAPVLSEASYAPRGRTALLDAVGRALTETTDYVNTLPADPGPSVVVVILTDGEENASKEFKLAAVEALIQARRDAGWDFVFLAANIDATQTASTMGIAAADAVPFESSREGTRAAFSVMSERVETSRRSRSSGPRKIH